MAGEAGDAVAAVDRVLDLIARHAALLLRVAHEVLARARVADHPLDDPVAHALPRRGRRVAAEHPFGDDPARRHVPAQQHEVMPVDDAQPERLEEAGGEAFPHHLVERGVEARDQPDLATEGAHRRAAIGEEVDAGRTQP